MRIATRRSRSPGSSLWWLVPDASNYPGVYNPQSVRDVEGADPNTPMVAAFPHLSPDVFQGAVLDLLVAKGYLARRYPLTLAEYKPALLAALTAAPPAPAVRPPAPPPASKESP